MVTAQQEKEAVGSGEFGCGVKTPELVVIALCNLLKCQLQQLDARLLGSAELERLSEVGRDAIG